MSNVLTLELEAIVTGLEEGLKTQREFTVGALVQLINTLRMIARLARSMEDELHVHRLREAGGRLSAVVSDLTSSANETLSRDMSGKVISPDFGRKP